MKVSTKKDVLGGKYRLEKIIGKGGSGCVYLAIDYAVGKSWAIKELSKSDAMVLSEVEMMRDLEHPMLPRIVDRIETQEKVYLVMDYLKGINLQSILHNKARFSVSQVLNLGMQLCDVLGYLHAHEPPVIYCDMKPSNILLMPGAKIKLIDLGGAHFYHDANEKPIVAALTKGFAAPEQYEGLVSIQSDIYGLGATLASLCPAKIPRQLAKIIAKCQRTNPSKRYKSINSVAKALKLVQLRKRGFAQAWKVCLMLALMGLLWGNVGDVLKEARSKAYIESIKEKQYESAIEIFPDESQPYLEILKEYKNRGETAAGILKVENLLGTYASDESEKQRVYLAIGKLYFSGNIFDETFGVDYETASKYFAKVGSDVYHYVDWYQRMAKSLCDFGAQINWQQQRSDLQKMEEACTAIADDEEKIATLYATATVYLTNRYYLASANCNPLQESTRILKMCRDLLRENVAISANDIIISDINMSIARNYILEGLQTNDEALLEESYELYEQVLEGQVQTGIRLDIMQKLAYIERCRGDYYNASRWYEKALEENQTDVETYCQYILMKLLEEKDITAATALFEKAGQLDGCESNSNYQTIKTRLEAIS